MRALDCAPASNDPARVMVRRARLLGTLVLVALLLPGIVGHDPWKQDEGYTFGIVLEMLQTGQWIVPTLAGQPFMEKPPLFYLSAAATARALAAWLPLHDGARIAAFVYIGWGLLCAALGARRIFGRGHGTLAALLIAGCLGFTWHSHEMISDASLFAGFSMAALGLAYAFDKPLKAGALAGTGIGVGFMSKGLVEPAMMGLAMALLPAAFRDWRSRDYAKSLAWIVVFGAPWFVLWPLLLHSASPQEFFTWFWINNIGRYFGFAHLGADTEPWYYTRTLPWFTMPAAPLAVYVLMRRSLVRDHERRGVQAMATMAAAIIIVLGTAATARSLYAMPLLIPLGVLASRGAMALPEAVGLWTARGVAAICAVAAAALSALWLYGTVVGHAPDMPLLTSRLPPDFGFPWIGGFALAAACVALIWFFVLRDRHATPAHRWTASIALVWGVTSTLLLPWLDSAKSFREPFEQIARRLGPDDCVVGVGLGENQRGMLHYIAGIRTAQALESDCSYVVWQRNHAQERIPEPLRRWNLVWEGARRGEADERFFLFRAPDFRYAAD